MKLVFRIEAELVDTATYSPNIDPPVLHDLNISLQGRLFAYLRDLGFQVKDTSGSTATLEVK